MTDIYSKLLSHCEESVFSKDAVTSHKTQKATTRKKKQSQVPSHEHIVQTEEHSAVMSQLIDDLYSPTVLSYPNFEEPFVLRCDASQEGLEAVLYQRQEGR